jgi:hypothetical protein
MLWANNNQISEAMTMNDKCPQCDAYGIFGYRDKQSGELTWFCAAHRFGQDWADARRDNERPLRHNPSNPTWEGWQQ